MLLAVLDNAVKFTPAGKRVSLSIRALLEPAAEDEAEETEAE